MAAHVLLSISGHIATVTLNNPRKRNPLSTPLIAELAQALRRCDENDQVGVVILTGAGESFSAGADLQEFSESLASGSVEHWTSGGPWAELVRLVEYAHRRHWVERYHEEAKGLLGWDQYQGRLWAGFHRHAVTVMLAYSFLVWQEFRQRCLAGELGGRQFPAYLDQRERVTSCLGDDPLAHLVVETGYFSA